MCVFIEIILYFHQTWKMFITSTKEQPNRFIFLITANTTINMFNQWKKKIFSEWYIDVWHRSAELETFIIIWSKYKHNCLTTYIFSRIVLIKIADSLSWHFFLNTCHILFTYGFKARYWQFVGTDTFYEKLKLCTWFYEYLLFTQIHHILHLI